MVEHETKTRRRWQLGEGLPHRTGGTPTDRQPGACRKADVDRHSIVRHVPELDVPFRLRTHADGTQTVEVREGLGLVDPLIRLIDQVYRQREADCIGSLTAALRAADAQLDHEHAASLARAITAAAMRQDDAEQGVAEDAFCFPRALPACRA